METDEGDVVTVPREEIERIRPERSRSIDIEDFVELAQIDPVFFEKSYYAVPASTEATKPYVLFHHAMREAGRIGVGRFVLRTKPHLVAIRPMEKVLAVETMFFGDEVRDPAALVPGLDGVEVDERELDLAVTLIDTLKTEWTRRPTRTPTEMSSSDCWPSAPHRRSGRRAERGVGIGRRGAHGRPQGERRGRQAGSIEAVAQEGCGLGAATLPRRRPGSARSSTWPRSRPVARP